jgi:hypothetical protein
MHSIRSGRLPLCVLFVEAVQVCSASGSQKLCGRIAVEATLQASRRSCSMCNHDTERAEEEMTHEEIGGPLGFRYGAYGNKQLRLATLDMFNRWRFVDFDSLMFG